MAFMADQRALIPALDVNPVSSRRQPSPDANNAVRILVHSSQ